MADLSVVNLSTAVVGFSSAALTEQIQNTNNITETNGTLSIGNIDLSNDINETRPGWLTGRRPSQGQVFPRGVYNK